jgi:urease accessory protein
MHTLRARMPLAVQRAFHPEGDGPCHAVILHPPGGMVGGDALGITISAEPGAEALITTPSAAKWYRAASPASLDTRITIATGGCVEWLPLETIVYDGASARQSLRVTLAADAIWMGSEITRFGRSARGEKFTHGRWCSHTEVWRDADSGGEPLWIDRQALTGGSPLLENPYGLAGAPVIGSFAAIGFEPAPALLAELRAQCVVPDDAGIAGVTALPAGIVCRYRGKSSSAARACFALIWDALRRNVRGRAAVIPRIWHT